jgi:ubiquinone/menaquinone biosynthesis C-methylase UbiE/DNA-binding transcriptional ArsR family regulator
MHQTLPADAVVAALKAAAEPTRLRILLLLVGSELSVKDLTQILGQSQPRISRHLKLLHEADLIARSREGSWVYFTLATGTPTAALALSLVGQVALGDGAVARDRERADALKIEREAAAQAYFATHAAEWDQIRSLYVAEGEVEAAILAAVANRRYDLLVDLGTGTGRMLELLAGHYVRGLGIDANHAMLAYARSKLGRMPPGHATVRHSDIYNLTIADGMAGAVVMHQVLHFLSDPVRAIREAARILEPGGDLLIVDFAPHDLEFLRERFAHDRLGFARPTIEAWLREAGLELIAGEELAPPRTQRGDKLTVSLWLARRRGAPLKNILTPSGVGRLQTAE